MSSQQKLEKIKGKIKFILRHIPKFNILQGLAFLHVEVSIIVLNVVKTLKIG